MLIALLSGALPLARAYGASGMVTEVITVGNRPVDEVITFVGFDE